MEFRVLGALEVWDGETKVEIPGRSHPRILAGLLLNTGRAVSLSWLVDLLWDDAPPATARRQVQNAVAALRRRLAPIRGDLVERTGQSFRVNLAEDELDLRRFESAARRARLLADQGRWKEALAGFEAALGLWRGPALDRLPGRTLESAAARLNDLRLSTYEDHADAALALGRPDPVIAALPRLVRENPSRQRLTGRLMHALHQARRTPEALRLFDGLRATLAESGLEPGSELRDLHVRILQADPALVPGTADPVGPPGGPRGIVPAQLPTDVVTFTGRESQLAALDLLRDSGARAGVVSAITGIGGVGKTALAVHWGHARREDFPDGQLYINLRGFDEREPLTPLEAVSRLLRTLGQPAEAVPSDLDEAAARYRSLLADRRVLVLLDNARTTEQVRPLLPASPGSLALVTSRNRLAGLIVGHDAQAVHVDALSGKESLELLANLIGEIPLDDRAAAERVCELCGRLPLALRIVAANLGRYPDRTLEQTRRELDDDSRLSRLDLGEDDSANLTAVFDLSYRALSPNARDVFSQLGLVPGDDFTPELAAAITAGSGEAVRAAFDELAAAHLVEEHGPGRYRFHDLVRLYARETASTTVAPAVRETIIDRLIDWYSDDATPQRYEFNNIVAACDAFSEHGRLWKLVAVLRTFATAGSDLEVARRCAERALAATEESGRVAAQIDVLVTLAAIHGTRGDKGEGIETCRRAVDLLPGVTDLPLEGQVLATLGTLLFSDGKHAEAERHLLRSLRIAEEIDDGLSVLIRTGNLGRVCRASGRYREAETHLRRARDQAEQLGKPSHFASSLASLGFLYCDTGKYSDALSVSRQALRLAEDNGATRIMILAMMGAGVAAKELDRFDEALGHFERALELAREEHRLGLHIGLLDFIADVQLHAGHHRRALEYLDMADALAEAGGNNRADYSLPARIACRASTATGAHDRAVAHGIRACEINRVRQDPLDLARSLDALGDAHRGNDSPGEARTCWTEALEILDRLDHPEAAGLRAKLTTD